MFAMLPNNLVTFGETCGSSCRRSSKNLSKAATVYNGAHLKVGSCFKNKYFTGFNNSHF